MHYSELIFGPAEQPVKMAMIKMPGNFCGKEFIHHLAPRRFSRKSE
jgi:hypothetical protein